MLVAFVNTPESSPFYRLKRSFFNGLNHVSLGFLVAGTLFAAWLVVQDVTKQRIIDDLDAALHSGNIHIVINNTDWNMVRDTMKSDLQRRARRNASLPQQPQQLDALVDYYVRPESVPVLFETYRSKASHMNIRDFVRRAYFSGLTEITLELGSPPQFDKPWLNHQQPVRAVFDMRGMEWTLKRIDAPDYLIPTQALVLIKSDTIELSDARLARAM